MDNTTSDDSADIAKNSPKIIHAEISDVSKVADNLTRYVNQPLTFRLPYPHTSLSSFSKAFRDFIHQRVYNGFKDIVFGSYNRAIQSYYQRIRSAESGNQLLDKGLPIFNYTIQIDGPDDKLDLPWRSTNSLPGLGKVLFPSFYEDDTFELKVVYRRLKGSINSNIYCSSEAEGLDIQMALYDGFRGINTYSETAIRAMTILPSEMLFIDNKGRRFSKALTSDKIVKNFIPGVNNTCYYVYNNIDAILQMVSLNPSHSYYGGTGLPEFTLSASFGFEINIPQFVLCLTKENFVGIEINLDVEYNYNDDRVINAIQYITGRQLDVDINKDPYGNEVVSFENGQIINSVAYRIPSEDTTIIPLSTLFENKKFTNWSYKNRDIIVFIIYSGGVIRVPIDDKVAEYNDNGDIELKMDLFNKDDFLKIHIFKLSKDIEI